MPVVAAIVAGGLLVGTGAGLALTGWTITALGMQVFFGLGSSLLIGGISRAIAKKPNLNSLLASAQGRLVTAPQAAASRRVIYGNVRVGGVVTFLNLRGTNNNILDMVITICGHEVSDIKTLIFDGQTIDLDGSGDGTGQWAGKVHMENNLGTDGQTAFSGLMDAAPGIWTSDHRQRGCAGVYLSLTYDEKLFPNGLPNIQFEVDGKPLYDPRTTLTEWSENPALAILDFLTNTRYGAGVTYATGIDEDAFIAAANICDEGVDTDTASPPSAEHRYSLNGVFDFDEEFGNVVQQMAAAMGGYVTRVGGLWAAFPGAYRIPVDTLTDEDFIQSPKVQFRQNKRDLFNGVKGTFVDANRDYQQTDFPAVQVDGYVTEDNGEEHWKDVYFPFSRTSTTCQRLARLDLERNRRQITIDCVFRMRAYQFTPCDVVEVTHARYGWSDKTFEVVDSRLTLVDDDHGNPALAVALVLRETDVDVYGFAVDDYGNEVDAELIRLQNRTLPFGWSPGVARGQSSTAATMLPISDFRFGVAQRYDVAADGSTVARLEIGGMMPTNVFSETLLRPRTRNLALGTASTGGHLKGGQRYYACVCAIDDITGGDVAGRVTHISEIAAVTVPAGTDTNTITINGLKWDSGTVGWLLFVGTDPYRMSYQTGYLGSVPTSVSLTGPDAQPTAIQFLGFNVPAQLPNGYWEHLRGCPDQKAERIRLRVFRAPHLGVFGATVDSTTATTIKLSTSGLTANVFAGRYVSLIGLLIDGGLELAVGGGVQSADYLIESNDGDTLTLAAGQADPSAAGINNTAVVVVRTSPTSVSSDATGNYVEDSAFGQVGQDLGDSSPDFGGGDDSLQGMLLRIIAGTGAGESYVIKSNIVASKRIYIEGDWTTTPDSSSVFVVTDSHPVISQDTEPLMAQKVDSFGRIHVELNNLPTEQYFIEAAVISPEGKESPAESNPFREIYKFGIEINIIAQTSSVSGFARDPDTGHLVIVQPTSPPATIDLESGVGSVHGIIYVDSFSGADFGARLELAMAAAQAGGVGAIVDARAFTGAQSCAVNPWSGITVPVTLLLGDITISTTAAWVIAHPDQGIVGAGVKSRLKYTGGATAAALLFDASGFANGYRFIAQRLFADANGLADHAVWFKRAVHGSVIDDVAGTNSTAECIRVSHCVSAVLRSLRVSSNIENFTTVPTVGLLVDDIAGDKTSDCVFEDAVMEGITAGLGIYEKSQANTYLRGTSESNGTGLHVADVGELHKFDGLYFENNSVQDVLCDGFLNRFDHLLANSVKTADVQFSSTSYLNEVHGGQIDRIQVDSGAAETRLMDTFTSHGIIDNGTNTATRNCFDANDGFIADRSPNDLEQLQIRNSGGISRLRLRAGSGQAGNNLLETIDSGGGILGQLTDAGVPLFTEYGIWNGAAKVWHTTLGSGGDATSYMFVLSGVATRVKIKSDGHLISDSDIGGAVLRIEDFAAQYFHIGLSGSDLAIAETGVATRAKFLSGGGLVPGADGDTLGESSTPLRWRGYFTDIDMSGTLALAQLDTPLLRITDGAAAKWHLQLDGSNNLQIVQTGVAVQWLLSGADILPNVTNTQNLGSSSKRPSAFLHDVDIDNALTIGSLTASQPVFSNGSKALISQNIDLNASYVTDGGPKYYTKAQVDTALGAKVDLSGGYGSVANGYQVSGTVVVRGQQSHITHVSGSAGASYTATEQTLLNDCAAAVNNILAMVETHGLTA